MTWQLLTWIIYQTLIISVSKLFHEYLSVFICQFLVFADIFFLECHLSIKIKLNFYSKYYHYMFKNSKGNAFLRLCSLSNGMHRATRSRTAVEHSFVPRGLSVFKMAVFLKAEKHLGSRCCCRWRISCRKT